MSAPALKRWSHLVHELNGRRVIGMPGVRDIEERDNCEDFNPGKPDGGCDTDGHYMCDECTHRNTCEGCGKRPTQCECDMCKDCYRANWSCRCQKPEAPPC